MTGHCTHDIIVEEQVRKWCKTQRDKTRAKKKYWELSEYFHNYVVEIPDGAFCFKNNVSFSNRNQGRPKK